MLGVEVSDGVRKDARGFAVCFFDVPSWPGVIVNPQDSGVNLAVSTQTWTIGSYVPPDDNPEQQPVTAVSDVGDAAWWRVHVELANVHIDAEDTDLYVLSAPFQFTISLTQVPNPRGFDKSAWLTDLTTLGSLVLAGLGR